MNPILLEDESGSIQNSFCSVLFLANNLLVYESDCFIQWNQSDTALNGLQTGCRWLMIWDAVILFLPESSISLDIGKLRTTVQS